MNNIRKNFKVALLFIVTFIFATSTQAVAENLSISTDNVIEINVETYQATTIDFTVTNGATVTPIVGENRILDSQTAGEDGQVSFTFTSDLIKEFDGSNVVVKYLASKDGFSDVFQEVTYNINVKKINIQTNNSYIQFDGSTNSFLTVPNTLTSDDNFTIDFWMKKYTDTCIETTIYQNSDMRVYYFPDNSSETMKCNIQIGISDGDGGYDDFFTSFEVQTDLIQDTWKNITIKYFKNESTLLIQLFDNGEISNERTANQNEFPSFTFDDFIFGQSSQYALDELKVLNIFLDNYKNQVIGNRQILDSEQSNTEIYYNFEEGFGTTVTDISDNSDDSKNATITGDGTLRINFESSSVDFDNLSEPLYIPKFEEGSSIPSKLYTFDNNQISIGAWINLASNSSENQSIFQIFGDSTNYSFYMNELLEDDNNYRLAFLVNTADDTDTHTFDVNLSYKKWYYLSATYDNGKFTFYIDGVNVSEYTSEKVSTLGTLNQENTNSDFSRWYSIGSGFISDSNVFKDKLSQVSLWKKTLNEQEIKKIMHNFVNFEDNDLIGYWSLNKENENTSLNDDSTLNFTDNFSTWTSEQIPVITGENIYGNDSQIQFFNIFKSNSLSDESLTYSVSSGNSTAALLNETFIEYTPLVKNDNFTINSSLNEYSLAISAQRSAYEEKLILNLNNYNVEEVSIQQVELISTNAGGSTVHEIENLSNANTIEKINLAGASYDSPFRLKFTQDISDPDSYFWYYNFQNETLDFGVSGDFTNYEINLPSGQNVLDIDLSTWVGNPVAPQLADTTINDVSESTANSSIIGVLNGFDSGNDDNPQFVITGNSNEYFEVIYENSQANVYLTSTAQLDYETQIQYDLRVKVTNLEEQITKDLVIKIANEIDTIPQLEEESFEYNIKESIASLSTIASITPSNLSVINAETATLNYELTGTGASNFTINSNGEIKVSESASLNATSTPSYDLTLKVSTEAGNLDTPLTINVFKNNPPTLSYVFDRYIILNSQSNLFGIKIEDEDEDSLEITYAIDSNDIISVSSENQENLYVLTVNSLEKLGKATITLTVDDGAVEVSKSFNVFVEEETRFKSNFEVIELNEFNESNGKTITQGEKFYTFVNNRGNNINSSDTQIYFTSIKVLDSEKLIITKYKDLNSTVEIINQYTRYYTQTNGIISVYSDENKSILVSTLKISELTSASLVSVLSDTNTTYEVNPEEDVAYELLKKVENNELEIYDEVNYNGTTYNNLYNFMTSFSSSNTLGAIRSYDRKKVLVFNNPNSTDSEGSLTEIDIASNSTSELEASWEIIEHNGKQVLLMGAIEGYEDNVAFTLNDSNKIAKAKFLKSSEYTKELLFGKQLKQNVYSSLSQTPVMSLSLSNTWSYISLTNTVTLCDDSIQEDLSLCYQDKSIDDVFGNSSIDYILKHDGSNWSYWDKDASFKTKISGINKFSAITAKDGLLIKINSSVTISVPFMEEDNDEQEFMRIYENGWYLTSITNYKSAADIEKLVEDANPTKKISTILILRDSQWQVYSPDEDANGEDEISSEIKNTESFWIDIQDK